MMKRRIDEVNGSEPQEDSELSRETKRQRRHLIQVIEDETKNLFHAFKLARGFERQKLGRRQKSAKKKESDGDMERLELEVVALKKLQLAELADTYFSRQLLKSEAIAAHDALPKNVKRKASTDQPKDSAYVNVTSRLYKSAPVTKCMERAMRSIRGVLRLREEEIRKKKKRMRKADYEAETNDQHESVDHPSNSADVKVHTGQPTSEHSNSDGEDGLSDPEGAFEGFNDEIQLEDAHGISDHGSEDEDMIDFAEYDARIASESDEDSSDGEELADGLTIPKDVQPDIDMASLSASEISEPDDPPPVRRQATNVKIDASRSAFLPSLNTGYISGSESDASDASVLAPPRKNRMGQRARQEMWERKYGSQARHLQKEGQSAQNRDRGWDMKRGAQENNRGIGGRRGGRDSGRGRAGRGRSDRFDRGPDRARHMDSRNSSTAGHGVKQQQQREQQQKTPTYGNTHPSWLAKQAAKEKASAASKPAGKKIVFG